MKRNNLRTSLTVCTAAIIIASTLGSCACPSYAKYAYRKGRSKHAVHTLFKQPANPQWETFSRRSPID
ncbi:MAG: hypothetical protein ACK5BL_12200 [Flavobacteriales bacterium]